MLSTRTFLRLSIGRSLSTISSAQKQQIFFSSSQFAIVGASTNPNKWGFKFMQLFRLAELPVTAVNPNCSSIRGTSCVSSVNSLPSPHKTSILVVTPPAATLQVLKDAKDVNAPMIWIQPGAADFAVQDFISANRMEDRVVLDGPELLTAPIVTFVDPLSSSSEWSAAPKDSSSTDRDLISTPSSHSGRTSATSQSPDASNPNRLTLSASSLPGDQASSGTRVLPQPDGGPCGAITMLQFIIDHKANGASNSRRIPSERDSDLADLPGGSTRGQLTSQSVHPGLQTLEIEVSNRLGGRRSPNSSFDDPSNGTFTVDNEFPGMP